MKMKRSTKAFWQGVFASLVASVLLEAVKGLASRAEEAEAPDVDLPPLPFVDDMDPVIRLALRAAVGLGVAVALYFGLQKTGMKLGALVLPIVAVVAVIGAYVWLVF